MCQAHEKGVSSTKPEEIAVAVTVDGKPDKEAPRGSLRGLYRYADLTDAMLLLVGTLAVIAGATNQPLQLIVFGRLMDSFNLSNKDEVRDRVHLMAGLYACLGVMQVVTNSIHVTCYSKVAARQARRIRLAYFRALARKPMSFFDAPGQDAGALASSVMDKALTVQIGLGDDLAKLLLQTVQFATSLTTALYFVWPLALVSLGAVPCLSVVVGFANAAYARATRNSAAVLDMATSTPLEAVGAIRTVNAYCRERPILSLYSEMCSSARAQGMALGRARAMLEGTVAPIMFVMFGGCLWFGSSLVSNDMQKHDYCSARQSLSLPSSLPIAMALRHPPSPHPTPTGQCECHHPSCLEAGRCPPASTLTAHVCALSMAQTSSTLRPGSSKTPTLSGARPAGT